MADSKHTSIMLTSWATTRRMGPMKKRRVGNQLVKFEYPEYLHYHYVARHYVDDNNNNRQGCLSFEEAFVMKDWTMRQFGFLFALSVTNAYMAHNYFVQKSRGLVLQSKSEFTRNLCDEMINNSEWQDEMKQKLDELEVTSPQQRKRKTKRVMEHELATMGAGMGKWNNGTMKPTKQKYQKYRCAYKCGRTCRTYCVCDRSLVLCNLCFAIHFSSQQNDRN